MTFIKTTEGIKKSIVLIFVLSLLGCMKTPEVNKDFGPEYSANDMATTLGSAQYEATKD